MKNDTIMSGNKVINPIIFKIFFGINRTHRVPNKDPIIMPHKKRLIKIKKESIIVACSY
ncbi:hypothetical protein AA106556_0787 [Neokomagataea tanensis NBRC 106556]|uniref:Uncharacterized protein n=1 Tax=Neokomagataea tanensis NBRC 106556 TaxID=1223519 RepID=A0ABQ0QI69_9PROT|nr:hypothetical protein AA106556_0787 [Neokomagataea tanensis NBRC 106556]